MKFAKICLLAAMGLIISSILSGNAYSQDSYQPDLSLSLDQFEKEVLQEKDEVWVVDFWASWCGPCIRAVPHMKELHSSIADQPVRFISISWDRNAAKWENAMNRLQMPWQHIIVPKGKASFLDENFPHRGIPTAFVIHRNGKVKKVSDVYALDKAIAKALK